MFQWQWSRQICRIFSVILADSSAFHPINKQTLLSSKEKSKVRMQLVCTRMIFQRFSDSSCNIPWQTLIKVTTMYFDSLKYLNVDLKKLDARSYIWHSQWDTSLISDCCFFKLIVFDVLICADVCWLHVKELLSRNLLTLLGVGHVIMLAGKKYILSWVFYITVFDDIQLDNWVE